MGLQLHIDWNKKPDSRCSEFYLRHHSNEPTNFLPRHNLRMCSARNYFI